MVEPSGRRGGRRRGHLDRVYNFDVILLSLGVDSCVSLACVAQRVASMLVWSFACQPKRQIEYELRATGNDAPRRPELRAVAKFANHRIRIHVCVRVRACVYVCVRVWVCVCCVLCVVRVRA